MLSLLKALEKVYVEDGKTNLYYPLRRSVKCFLLMEGIGFKALSRRHLHAAVDLAHVAGIRKGRAREFERETERKTLAHLSTFSRAPNLLHLPFQYQFQH